MVQEETKRPCECLAVAMRRRVVRACVPMCRSMSVDVSVSDQRQSFSRRLRLYLPHLSTTPIYLSTTPCLCLSSCSLAGSSSLFPCRGQAHLDSPYPHSSQSNMHVHSNVRQQTRIHPKAHTNAHTHTQALSLSLFLSRSFSVAHTSAHIRTHAYTHIRIGTRRQICLANICLAPLTQHLERFACRFFGLCIHMYIHTYICIYIHICICIYMCVHK